MYWLCPMKFLYIYMFFFQDANTKIWIFSQTFLRRSHLSQNYNCIERTTLMAYWLECWKTHGQYEHTPLKVPALNTIRSKNNGANSVMPCELQDTWTSTLWTHIAEMSLSHFHIWLRVGWTSIESCRLATNRIGRPLSAPWASAVPQSVLCGVFDDSTLGPKQSGLACLIAVHASGDRLVHPDHNLTFDLRLDKITRRI